MQRFNCAILLFMCIGMAGATGFFPIEPGNRWEYRAANRAPLTIEVGRTPLSQNGRVYYQLTGYTTQPVWVRSEAAALYYLDQASGSEALLISFEPSETAWFPAPARECRQEGRALPERASVSVPAGSYESALVVAYRSLDCAGAGVLEEQFAANIGMLRRTIQTLAGPVAYELVFARAGAATAAPVPGAAFSVSLRRKAPDRITADLRLSVAGSEPVELVFPTSQEYEVVLRDSTGRELWRWSDGRAFAMVVLHKSLFDLAAGVEVPLDSLPPGSYTIDAWLTTASGSARFAASAPFRIPSDLEVRRVLKRPAGRLRL